MDASYCNRARPVAVCLLACLGLCLCATFAHAQSPAGPEKAQAQRAKAPKVYWAFQAPDRSAQNARWRESLSTTLQQTTFAPSAPAGRYLRDKAAPGGRLPPAKLEDLDAVRPPEKKSFKLGDKTAVHGEFTKESIGWRPHGDQAGSAGATPPLWEERRAGAYADFHPDEDVELKLGPEYHLGTSSLRPEQTGRVKDHGGSLGMGMKLKIDF